MVFKNKTFNKFWRFSSSFQLGIPIMTAIAVLIAWGTIVESRYDAAAARKVVYDSWMMWTTMVLLVYNLTIVVVDRWPWQKRHYPFIIVHAGIIVLIAGGYVTSKFGLDGQMTVPIGSKNNLASIGKTDIVVYATFDGDRYSRIIDREVDFFAHPPSADNAMVLDLGVDKINIIDYVPYALLDNKIRKTDEPTAGSSVRFQIMNSRVKQVEQITQAKKGKNATYNLGPAKVHLGDVPVPHAPANEIYLTPATETDLIYTLFHKDSAKPFKTGKIKIGEVVDTGWMGLEFRLLDYVPRAVEEYDIVKKEKPTELTTAAIQIEHKGVKRWVALNDVVKLFGDSSAFVLSYQNHRIPVGFDLHLLNFHVKRYQGISKAMGYESEVEIKVNNDSILKQTISMNEPMNYNGYTFYQSSFQEDPVTHEPTLSVFSVNKDPGRPIKYIGSILISIGIVWLFYQRRKKATAT
jgi:hypothetical protein